MKYKIWCVDNYKDTIAEYTSDIIPTIQSKLYFSHKGLYNVVDIVYHVSDDGDTYDNKILFVEICVLKIN